MTVPHYINEDRSEMRGIKPGWYAMDDAGKLKSGPFSSHEEYLSRITQPTYESNPSHLRHDSVETDDTRSASRAAPAEVQPGTAP
jgi:hypothetical protein